VHAELAWDPAGALATLTVTSGRGEPIVVDGAVIQHPLLGPAHAVGATAMSAIDWARPTEIPAIAEPGRLPPGAGGAILNVLAVLARRAGVTALRYAGPYPTPRLWAQLARSFRTTVGEARFTADALDRALRIARDPIPVDFAPAPHERIAIRGGYVDLREGLERVVIDHVAYAIDGSPARLVEDAGGGAVCEVWFGDAVYAQVATLAADGTLLDGPHPIPPCGSPVIGRAFPPALCAAIAELVAEAVPPPLADAARALCARQPLHWADLGARAAGLHVDDGDVGFQVHAALWDRIAPLGLARLALALAEALAPVVTLAALQRVAPQLADVT
ncbi:MAG TPA: hypothetical protein VGC42_30105, partial [Kofleriaceae bacterium]